MVYGLNSLGTLGNVVNALVNDHEVMGLEGLGSATADVIEGIALSGASKGAKRNAINKVINGSKNVARETDNLSDKALFEQRIYQLPPEAQAKLANGDWQIGTDVIYGIKYIGGSSANSHVSIFEAGDTTAVGRTNLIQGKTAHEDYFLATGIRIYTAVTSDSSADYEKAKGLAWTKPVANVTNGEFKFALENTTFIDKCASAVFNNNGDNNVKEGFYKLPTPKMLYPNRTLTLEFDMVGAIAEGTFIRAEICGVRTRKA